MAHPWVHGYGTLPPLAPLQRTATLSTPVSPTPVSSLDAIEVNQHELDEAFSDTQSMRFFFEDDADDNNDNDTDNDTYTGPGSVPRTTHTRVFNAGDWLVRQGEVGHDMFYIESGEVEVLVRKPHAQHSAWEDTGRDEDGVLWDVDEISIMARAHVRENAPAPVDDESGAHTKTQTQTRTPRRLRRDGGSGCFAIPLCACLGGGGTRESDAGIENTSSMGADDDARDMLVLTTRGRGASVRVIIIIYCVSTRVVLTFVAMLGSCIGEMSVLHAAPSRRTASVRALTPVTCLVMTKDALRAKLAAAPGTFFFFVPASRGAGGGSNVMRCCMSIVLYCIVFTRACGNSPTRQVRGKSLSSPPRCGAQRLKLAKP